MIIGVTQALDALAKGKTDAQDQLFELVYEELKKIAAGVVSGRAGGTLSATALVHEAYIKLGLSCETPSFENRRHFFGAAAQAMRQILIDRIRKKGSPKGGGEMIEMMPGKTVSQEDIVAVHEALDELAELEPDIAELVKLHFFAGLSLLECSEILQITDRTARRHWTFARTWLFEKLGGKNRAAKAPMPKS